MAARRASPEGMSSGEKQGTESAERDESSRRKPYEPPAIEQHAIIEVTTLGTAGPKPRNPVRGC